MTRRAEAVSPGPGRTRRSRRAEAAPLFTDGFTLCAWLHGRLGERADELSRSLYRCALALLGHVVLALKGFDREIHIDGADEQLVLLRVQLRLAAVADVLTEAQSLHALDIADRLGRQLGGWQRSIDAAAQ